VDHQAACLLCHSMASNTARQCVLVTAWACEVRGPTALWPTSVNLYSSLHWPWKWSKRGQFPSSNPLTLWLWAAVASSLHVGWSSCEPSHLCTRKIVYIPVSWYSADSFVGCCFAVNFQLHVFAQRHFKLRELDTSLLVHYTPRTETRHNFRVLFNHQHRRISYVTSRSIGSTATFGMEMTIPPRHHGPSTYRYTWDANGAVTQVTRSVAAQ
jgi:hypothetical protein